MSDSQREHPSTYFVQDRANEEELVRLQGQDKFMTAGMGGVLPEQADPTVFHRVLDVSCGTGGWLIETARTYPTMTQLVGVDISRRMIEYARGQAETLQVADRVEFLTMDALRMLEFPNDYFDLTNIRVGSSFLRTWDWNKLLQELQRVTTSEGVIRVTEIDMGDKSEATSPTIKRFQDIFVQILYQSGRLFTPDPDSLLKELPRLLDVSGLQNVQTRAVTLQFLPGTPELQMYFEDMQHLSRTILPFLQKWGDNQEDYNVMFQEVLSDIKRPDFKAAWRLITFWGKRGPSVNVLERS